MWKEKVGLSYNSFLYWVALEVGRIFSGVLIHQNSILASVYPWRPRGVLVKAMNCGIIVSEFRHQSHDYIHFQTNTLGKGMNPLILSAMG